MIGHDPRILDMILNGKKIEPPIKQTVTGLEGVVSFVKRTGPDQVMIYIDCNGNGGQIAYAGAYMSYPHKTELELLPLRGMVTGEKVTCTREKDNYWWLDFGEKLGKYRCDALDQC